MSTRTLYLNANPAAREAAGSACCGESLGTAARLRASLHTWLELFKGMCQNTNLRAQKGTGTSGVQANGNRATAAKTLLKVFCRCTDLRVGQSGPSPPRNPVVVVETQTCPQHLILCPRASRTLHQDEGQAPYTAGRIQLHAASGSRGKERGTLIPPLFLCICKYFPLK